MIEEEWNALWRLVAQTSGWMLPSKEDVFLQCLPIEE
jgi:hypothetical protein